jgi:hypothetical protein
MTTLTISDDTYSYLANIRETKTSTSSKWTVFYECITRGYRDLEIQHPLLTYNSDGMFFWRGVRISPYTIPDPRTIADLKIHYVAVRSLILDAYQRRVAELEALRDSIPGVAAADEEGEWP